MRLFVVRLSAMKDDGNDIATIDREWATTRAKYVHADDPPVPVSPTTGSGWRLVGMTHVEGRHETAILFAWERIL